MFERYDVGEQAVLVHVYFSQVNLEDELSEFQSLVSSAGIDAVESVLVPLKTPVAKYFVGSGKAEELAEIIKTHQVSVLIVNHTLTPSQERNLEQLCQCRVIDRTGLILDIFAQRARTHEGKLQVELAQLRHLSTRLVRGWTHLERQKGGIGLRGPGETQLETDRRLLKNRIQFILSRLDKVEKQREQNRRTRQKANIPTVSLVGYTNAGKSTLFNTLTNAQVYAADKLFATLDPTLRSIQIEDVGDAILADTVGFIRHLPHELVSAFKATLQETRQATLLLHVIDAADPNVQDTKLAVDSVLDEIGAGEIPTLLVMNKIDKLPNLTPRIEYNDEHVPVCVWLSAHTEQGIDLLYQALRERLVTQLVEHQLIIPPALGKLRSLLYACDAVLAETITENGNCVIHIRLPIIEWNRLCKQAPDLIYLSEMTC